MAFLKPLMEEAGLWQGASVHPSFHRGSGEESAAPSFASVVVVSDLIVVGASSAAAGPARWASAPGPSQDGHLVRVKDGYF